MTALTPPPPQKKFLSLTDVLRFCKLRAVAFFYSSQSISCRVFLLPKIFIFIVCPKYNSLYLVILVLRRIQAWFFLETSFMCFGWSIGICKTLVQYHKWINFLPVRGRQRHKWCKLHAYIFIKAICVVSLCWKKGRMQILQAMVLRSDLYYILWGCKQVIRVTLLLGHDVYYIN